MLARNLTRRLGTGAACLALSMVSTGCASLAGAALERAGSHTPSRALGARSTPSTALATGDVIGGSMRPPAANRTASVYMHGATLGWRQASGAGRRPGGLPISSVDPGQSPSCGGVPFGLARSLVSPGSLPPGPLRGMAPIQQAQTMTSSIVSPYYRPAGFSAFGRLITASVAVTDPRCGHSVFAFVRFDVLRLGGTSSPSHQLR